jgi:diphthamide synthase (EF-2-diphthine--ammonia ligase)
LSEARRIAFGDIFLADVRRYREDLAHSMGFDVMFPLWGEEPSALADEVLDSQISARVVCVDTDVLGAEFAGRTYDRAFLDAIPPTIDPCGERGEFHTFVSAGPGFRSAVPYSVGETVLREERFAYCDLLPVEPA